MLSAEDLQEFWVIAEAINTVAFQLKNVYCWFFNEMYSLLEFNYCFFFNLYKSKGLNSF